MKEVALTTENFDGKSPGNFIESDGPWLGVIAEVLNDHEFAVIPLKPWKLKDGHTRAMLGSHDKVERIQLVASGHIADLNFFVLEGKDDRFDVRLVSDRCNKIDEAAGLKVEEVWEWIYSRRDW